MKLKSMITHLAIFSVGVALTFSYFIFDVLPATSKYIPAMDVKLIELPGADEPIYYGDIIEKRYLAGLYLGSPFYFFKRSEGLKIDSELASLGYTPAMYSAFAFSYGASYKDASLDEKSRYEHLSEAYKWAKLAEAQGFYWPIMTMVSDQVLESNQDLSTHLEKIDGFVKSSSIGGPAEIMAEYFEKQGDEEKAKYYQAISEKIEAENRPQPLCYTIKPFKGL